MEHHNAESPVTELLVAAGAPPQAATTELEQLMPIDEARFRQAMGYFASGVTVVTTEHNGEPYGMTVSSFSSLSLVPPLVLICIDKSAPTHQALLGAGKFVVNVLEKRQEHLSRRFATTSREKFKGVAWHSGTLALPVLDHVLAVIECRVHATIEAGDHTIFVGEVYDTDVHEGAPLLYFRRGYHELK
ncbi:MAG TPA: flavin reductase family protein [Kouleothrix sp.]|uniref:flavin reductase family protein n=1 Tax=Kouleothrix sp. TaxID=2779161 RepID=UPI002B7FE0FD|nr:flavin reductase family protein [Kouleothrix sp.]HRC77927.1 flavin reductase family protein [Kouleothrix sp.]